METVGKKVIELKIEDVLPNRFQPRIKFNEEAITELSKSIKEHGVIQPIVVRPIGDKFEIIAGERRYKASCMADLKTIPAIITDLNDKDSAEVALIENVQRENLTPIEEAISYKKILDMGYITQDALATKLGKTQSTVANKLRLLNLDDEVQEALLNEKISERHARSLLRLTDKTQQKELLKKIIDQRLTVRRTDDEIEKMLNGGQETTLSKEEPKQPIAFEQKQEENNFPTFNIEQTIQTNSKPKEETPNILDSIIQNNNEEQTTIPETRENSSFRFINMPLEQTENKEEPKPEETVEEESNDEIKPGKFFNILNSEEPKQEEPQTTQTTEEIFNFDNIFNQAPTSELETKSLENNAMLEELNEIENSINNSETLPPIFEENTNKETPKEEPKQEEKDDFEDEFIEEVIEDADEEKESDPSMEETSKEEPQTMNETIVESEPEINDFKDVLQVIRDCSDKIEAAGFIIDTEEIDLDNIYQVTFRINK